MTATGAPVGLREALGSKIKELAYEMSRQDAAATGEWAPNRKYALAEAKQTGREFESAVDELTALAARLRAALSALLSRAYDVMDDGEDVIAEAERTLAAARSPSVEQQQAAGAERTPLAERVQQLIDDAEGLAWEEYSGKEAVRTVTAWFTRALRECVAQPTASEQPAADLIARLESRAAHWKEAWLELHAELAERAEQPAAPPADEVLLQHARLGERFDAEQPAAQERTEPHEFLSWGANNWCVKCGNPENDSSHTRMPPAPEEPSLRAAPADPTDPGHDVGTLREHVRHLERHVRQLAVQLPATEPAKLSDEQLTQIIWKLAPSAEAESVLIRESGPYDVAKPTHLLRRLAELILTAAGVRP